MALCPAQELASDLTTSRDWAGEGVEELKKKKNIEEGKPSVGPTRGQRRWWPGQQLYP
jgi:hypothetical protein